MMGAALFCGAASAQTYYGEEDVIVRPSYQPVQKQQLLGRINGEVNPTEFSLSREVAFSDLDLSRGADMIELRSRVRHAARELCFELNAQVPELRGYPSEDRECVRKATRNAMLDAMYGRG
jgi:UrcA family protein